MDRVDLHEFQQHLSDARSALQRQDRGIARQRFLAAVDLYRGDFLESDLYEEWTVEPRRSYSAAFARALAWLAGDAAQSKDWERVLDYAGEIVRREPCDEEGHRRLMTAYWQLGRRARALHQYQLCSARLLEDLGVAVGGDPEAVPTHAQGRRVTTAAPVGQPLFRPFRPPSLRGYRLSPSTR